MPTLKECIARCHDANPQFPLLPKESPSAGPWLPPVTPPEPPSVPAAPRPRSEESLHRARAKRIGVTWATYRRRLLRGDRWCWGHMAWHPTAAFGDARAACSAWRRAYDRAQRRGVTMVAGRRGRG